MPEGDTIHKIAAFLAPRLENRTVESLRLAMGGGDRAVGRRIDAVEARGKHLYIGFDNGLWLRSHLGMHGSWHSYPSTTDWQKPSRRASLVLGTVDAYYVCFNAKEVELVARPSVRERVLDSRLGPDLAQPGVDVDALPARARAIVAPETLLMDVLLDQRIAAGIGNVYKCELLFLGRYSPSLRLGEVSDAALRGTFALAADLLQRNLGGGKRVTRFERDGAGRLWVYGRAGKRCLACDVGVVTYQRLGQHHRGTYWCPRCQSTDEHTG
ncbi:MAG: DNA-formamidopyrimidine glycosylase family protein [Pseudomonadota bacterium]